MLCSVIIELISGNRWQVLYKRLLILESACRSEDYLVKVTQSSKVRKTTEQWALRKYNCKSEFHCFLYKNICSKKQTWPRIFYRFKTLKISIFLYSRSIHV